MTRTRENPAPSREITVELPGDVAAWLDARPGETTTEKLLALARETMARDEEAREEEAYATLVWDEEIPIPNEGQYAALALVDDEEHLAALVEAYRAEAPDPERVPDA